MSGLKKLILWVLVLSALYFGLDYVTVHTSGDVVAYKRFAKAIMADNHYSARQASSDELAAKVTGKNEERMKAYEGSRVLFTYFDVIRQNLAKDGKSSFLVVDQVSRVGSRGQTGIWGDQEVRVRHRVRLERENHVWKVSEFIDPAMH